MWLLQTSPAYACGSAAMHHQAGCAACPRCPTAAAGSSLVDDRCAGIHGAISFRRHTSLPSGWPARGSSTPYKMSAIRLKVTVRNAEDEGQRHNHRCVGAIDRGDQQLAEPFTRNRFSVMIAPAKIVGMPSAIRVITGIRLFTRTCRTTTTRSVRPFARAVRT